MRHILRGFTMWVDGVDYGYEVEELQVALPEETYQEHNYGGAVMAANVPMVKIGLLEPTMKFGTANPTLAGMLMQKAGTTKTFTFRGALIDEIDGASKSVLALYEGRLATPAPDAWGGAGDKAGTGYTIKGVRYFRYEVGDTKIHEIGLMPARMVVNGVDLLSDINDALGR